jgi:hypothetical protein
MTNLRRIKLEKRSELRAVLKALYDAVAAEPVPQSLHDQLRRLQ